MPLFFFLSSILDKHIFILSNILDNISFVNLFLANLVPHIFFPTLLWCFAGFLGKELSEYDSLICYILLGFILLRIYWLPVMYNICEHKFKNEIMQEFIYKLKNNNKFSINYNQQYINILFNIAEHNAI